MKRQVGTRKVEKMEEAGMSNADASLPSGGAFLIL